MNSAWRVVVEFPIEDVCNFDVSEPTKRAEREQRVHTHGAEAVCDFRDDRALWFNVAVKRREDFVAVVFDGDEANVNA